MNDMSNNIVNHQNIDGTQYLQFKRLLEYTEIEHCYTMRHNQINIKTYENNDIIKVSYDKICNVLNFKRNAIIKPYQTHSDNIEIVQNEIQQFRDVDGLLTNKKTITLCTTSADCTSLIFYDPVKKVIGNIHSGWRGTTQKIGQKAVKKMIEKYECEPQNIICCICPHIRKCHFEVDEDVAKIFLDTFVDIDNIKELIVKGDIKEGKQKYYIDTTTINYNMLKTMGLKDENIIDSGICTVCEEKNFHSYRAQKEKSGRNGAMIMIKS